LYSTLSREIGLQFFSLLISPFFGINLMEAVANVCVKLPVSRHFAKYLYNGTLNSFQYFFTNLTLNPSGPPAELLKITAGLRVK
jgi:hypothetical protein